MRVERRTRIIMVGVGLLVAVLVLLIADSTLGLSPRACGLCHSGERAGLAETAHMGVGCLSCHLESGAWSLPGFKVRQWTRMYPAKLTSAPLGPARDVSRAACVSCHDSVGAQVVENYGIRFAHDSCAPAPARCDSCHGGVSHGKEVRWAQQDDMDSCVACHADNRAPDSCDTCHQGRVERDRLRRGVWRVTHGPEWENTHPMGDYSTCATCHLERDCVRCHGVPVPHPISFGSTHGGYGKLPGAKCGTCHDTTSFCDGCHRIEMPHPAGFLKGHKGVAKTRENPLCISCHEIKGCRNCHTRHDAHPDQAAMAEFRSGR